MVIALNRYALRLAVVPLAAAAVLLGVSATLTAQDSKSAAAAKELARVLESAKLDSIAAVDPSEPGVFVAALYIPGGQMLVVSAKYAAPPLLLDKINSKNYRDIYIDLNSASIAGTKIFVMDQNGDGLVARPGNDQPCDSWEQGTKQIAFDGQWKKAKISEEEYMKAFTSADERYARILSLLVAQAKQTKQTKGTGL